MSFLEEIYHSLDRTPYILMVTGKTYDEDGFLRKYNLPLPNEILLDTRKVQDKLNFSSTKTRDWLKEIYMELSVNIDSPRVQISDEERMFCTKIRAIKSNVVKKMEGFNVILGGVQNE